MKFRYTAIVARLIADNHGLAHSKLYFVANASSHGDWETHIGMKRAGLRMGALGTRLLALALFVVLTGCTVTRSDFPDYAKTISCKSGLGAYSLSRSELGIQVKERITLSGPVRTFQAVRVSSKPDPRHTYCLKFAGSPTSDDKVIVGRNTDGLLEIVSANVIDRSREITLAFLRLYFNIAAGIGAQREDGLTPTEQVVFDYELDPFDFVDMAIMNERLTDLGFCFVVSDYSYNHREIALNAYCDNPESSVAAAPPIWTKIFESAATLTAYSDQYGQSLAGSVPRAPVVTDTKLLGGILYRPRIPHTVLVLRENTSGAWQIQQRTQLLLENVSPILSVGVGRSFFAQRVSVLLFDTGVLQNVCVYKSSELVEFVKIPLSVASAIVALPTTIFQLRINDDGNKTLLQNAEKQLYEAQLAAIESEVASKAQSANTTLASSKLDAAFGNAVPEGATEFTGKTISFGENSAAGTFGCPATSPAHAQPVRPAKVSIGAN